MTRDEKILDAARRIHRIAQELFIETDTDAPVGALEMAKLMYRNFNKYPGESENSDKEMKEEAKRRFVEIMPELLKTYMNPEITRMLAMQGVVMDVDSFIEAFTEAMKK